MEGEPVKMAEKPKQAAPGAKGPSTGKEAKPWMAVLGLALLLGGIAWMIKGILTPKPKKKVYGH